MAFLDTAFWVEVADLMNRLLRMLKHGWFDEGNVRRALDKGAPIRLQERVAASERLHSGEIRVCIEAGLPLSYLWRQASARERAVAMFGKLGVWDTEHNNGVLIYVLWAERSIEIVADRGLNKLVSDTQWRTIAANMAAIFQAGHVEQGLNAAIDAVSNLLVQHFAVGSDRLNVNELPDPPVIF